MGGHLYWYFTPYQPDINTALQELRQQEFQKGRYNPAIAFPFDFNRDAALPGAQHTSIDAALKAADASGTRSILDIAEVSDRPTLCATVPLSADELLTLFATDKPTHEHVEALLIDEETPDHWDDSDEEAFEAFWDSIGRGQCKHLIVYENGKPIELFFIGYSFD